MRCDAALLWEEPGTWDVGEVELDPPQHGEVLVRLAATGLCHSDDHFATHDILLPHLPVRAGHDGAGVVEIGLIQDSWTAPLRRRRRLILLLAFGIPHEITRPVDVLEEGPPCPPSH